LALHFDMARPWLPGDPATLAKLAMADIFLSRFMSSWSRRGARDVEEAYRGLYLFTGCVLASS
jgi:hypothetical protein